MGGGEAMKKEGKGEDTCRCSGVRLASKMGGGKKKGDGIT